MEAVIIYLLLTYISKKTKNEEYGTSNLENLIFPMFLLLARFIPITYLEFLKDYRDGLPTFALITILLAILTFAKSIFTDIHLDVMRVTKILIMKLTLPVGLFILYFRIPV